MTSGLTAYLAWLHMDVRRAVDKRAVDKRAVDKRAVDKRAVDKRAVDKRTADGRTAEGEDHPRSSFAFPSLRERYTSAASGIRDRATITATIGRRYRSTFGTDEPSA